MPEICSSVLGQTRPTTLYVARKVNLSSFDHRVSRRVFQLDMLLVLVLVTRIGLMCSLRKVNLNSLDHRVSRRFAEMDVPLVQVCLSNVFPAQMRVFQLDMLLVTRIGLMCTLRRVNLSSLDHRVLRRIAEMDVQACLSNVCAPCVKLT